MILNKKRSGKMKKNNKKRKTRKELRTSVLLILILLFSLTVLCFGISIGFLINSFINESIDEILVNVLFNLIVGIIYFILLFILMHNKNIENTKTLKWYINGTLISLTITLIITAITIFTLQPGDGIVNYIIGISIFPLIGIISTPNIVKYAKKDTEKWKHIFYKNGNLESIKDSKDYYRVKNPVSFEKKILRAIYKEQFLNLLVVLGFMVIVIYLGVHYMITDHSYTNNVVTNIMQTRANRSFGFIFFMMIIFLAFGIPIIAFYITNALKKIRIVKNHEYLAYHAIVSSVRNNKITIFDGNKRFMYKYCTCVGIKEKNIHSTPATLIFVPDDLILFPDNDEYKVDKYIKTK